MSDKPKVRNLVNKFRGITKDKDYVVILDDIDDYLILDDFGCTSWYSKKYFERVTEEGNMAPSVLDVRKEQQEINVLKWCDNPSYSVAKKESTIQIEPSNGLLEVGTKESVQDLIKALQKSIDLGWVK